MSRLPLSRRLVAAALRKQAAEIYRFENRASQNRIVDGTVLELMDRMKSDGGSFVFQTGSGRSASLMIATRSEWDTSILNVSTARSNLLHFPSDEDTESRETVFSSFLDWMMTSGIEFGIVRFPFRDSVSNYVLHGVGGVMTDALVTFYRGTAGSLPAEERIRIREASAMDAGKVSRIAWKAFRQDHFHADPRLDSQKCHRLYAEWALNCVSGRAARVIVAVEADRVAGFSAIRIRRFSEASLGVIDLIAVHPSHVAGGIGSALLSRSLRWLGEMRIPSLYAGTSLANLPAMNLYIKAGFTPVQVESTFHLWVRGRNREVRS